MERSDRILAITLTLLFLSIMPAAAYTYNREATAAYVYDNALKDVPNSAYFQALGGDCTNFASYCLQAGGWKQIIDLSAGFNVYKSDQSWYSIFIPRQVAPVIAGEVHNLFIISSRQIIKEQLLFPWYIH